MHTMEDQEHQSHLRTVKPEYLGNWGWVAYCTLQERYQTALGQEVNRAKIAERYSKYMEPSATTL